MSDLPPPPPLASKEEKAKHILDALELEDRVQERTRSTPNLLTVLAPAWIWLAGLIWLPDTMPPFSWWMFTASCLGGFVYMLFRAVRAVRLDREVQVFTEKSKRRQDIEALAERQRLKKAREEGPLDGP